MSQTAILQPVFILALMTVVMNFWMICTRIPAMARLKIDAVQGQDTIKLRDFLPKEITRISNNYNHLLEQPTLFYAVTISIYVLGHVSAFNVGCAWVYAIVRIAHSLVQATIDHVPTRFALFLASSLALAAMTVVEAKNVLLN